MKPEESLFHCVDTHAPPVEPVKQKCGQTQVCDLKGFA